MIEMTAKEQLRERIEGLSEEQAERTLRLIDELRDPIAEFFDQAPPEDEPISDEEERAVQEARDEIARGEPMISLEQLKRELQ